MTNTPTGLDATTIILIGGQIVLVIGAIVTGIIAIITHMRVSEVSAKQALTTDKLDTVAASTEAIKGHVNSEKTAAEGRQATLDKENRLLREMLAKADTTAGLLAQAQSSLLAQTAKVVPQMIALAPTPTPAPVGSIPVGSLPARAVAVENIAALKENTEAVKENTATIAVP